MGTKREFLAKGKGALLALLLSLCAIHTAQANDWKLKDKDGVLYKLSEQKGKWVLVNFWAPWCPTCIQEMTELEAIKMQHKDVLVIGVAVMYRKNQEVIDVVRTQSVSYPIILGDEDIASDFGEMKGMPTSFLYSPTGELVGHHDGPLTHIDIEQAIAQKPVSAEIFSH